MSSIGGCHLPENIINSKQETHTAMELARINAIKDILYAEYSSPSLDLLHYFASRLSTRGQSERMVDQLGPIVREAFDQWFDEVIKERRRTAENKEAEQRLSCTAINQSESGTARQDVLMTAEEFEKCFIVDIC
jgi:hypothetical protein